MKASYRSYSAVNDLTDVAAATRAAVIADATSSCLVRMSWQHGEKMKDVACRGTAAASGTADSTFAAP